MYTAEYAKNGDLKHSTECTRAFSRLDSQCPRCAELKEGAKPRSGWQKEHYAQQQPFIFHTQASLDRATALHARKIRAKLDSITN